MQIELMATESLLTAWKKDPAITKHQLSIRGHNRLGWEHNHSCLTREEVSTWKAFLLEHAPSHYCSLFPEELCRIDEAANVLGVSTSTIYRLIKSGRITAKRTLVRGSSTRRYAILRSSLRCSKPPAAP